LSERITVGSDLEFVRYLRQQGGETMKKCFQCATCSVACELSPKEYAFPRKEMIQSSWGLKDKLMADPDIWLCHGCMDCSQQCPRGARPADLMGALRSYIYMAYAFPKFMGKAFTSPKYLPALFIFAMAAIFMLVLATNVIVHNGDMKLFSVRDGQLSQAQMMTEGISIPEEEFNFTQGKISFNEYAEKGGKLNQAEFISKYGVLKYEDFIHKLTIEALFIPGNLLIFFLAFMGFKNYWKELNKGPKRRPHKKFIPSAFDVLGDFLFHKKFSNCPTNSNRYYGHIYAFYGFIGTMIATGLVVVGEVYHYGHIFSSQLMMDISFYLPYPMSLLHPVKILGMVSGFFLLTGLVLFLLKRIKTDKHDGKSTYNDWLFLLVILGVAFTGLLIVFLRISGVPAIAYTAYFIHLTLVFFLLWYMPWSKFAHIIYRYLGLCYLKMYNRENKPEVFFQKN
jgi:quinone-modifying oxidoreductase, subunit QmoC